MPVWPNGFLDQWRFAHQMTLAFVNTIPDAHWEFSPHDRYAPFCKQLRHLIGVRGVYRDAICSGSTDFSRKHEYYTGDLTRATLRAALVTEQEEFLSLIASPACEDASRPIAFFDSQFSLEQYTYIVIHHEGIHQGQWALYAALAGFDTPQIWGQWGL
jgi:hypothetical protein